MKILRMMLLGASFIVLSIASLHAYAFYAKWGSSPVRFYINPVNRDVSQAAAITAIQAGANYWVDQTNASIAFQYEGTSTATAWVKDDRQNNVFFRNEDGNALATTYSLWTSADILLDSDIIFWDLEITWYTGTTGCGAISNSVYIEDVAAHEFGHLLGLSHTTVVGATMYPSVAFCSQINRTLASDDIAGIEFLYPPASKPTISLTKSSSPSAILQGSITTFTIQYRNTGTTNATNVVITDVIPAGSTLIAGSITQPSGVTSSVSGGTITWTVGSVASGAPAQNVSFQVRAN
jgi:uncharacterized repeat protein (TIGR01451 family)